MSVRQKRNEDRDQRRERPGAEEDRPSEARLDSWREKAKTLFAAADKAIKREAEDRDDFLTECRQEGGQ